MSSQGAGPGTVRVGRFIGRVGVVTLPAVQVALDLDERVVRRHVKKLEDLGWLMRRSWLWGEGSLVWLTAAGVDGVGLHGIRPVKIREGKQPGMSTIDRGVLVGITAARIERRGYEWKSARELAVNEDRWAVEHRHDHGTTTQLPDIAIWKPGAQLPIAIVVEGSRRREDRQKWRLDGWRDAINAGQYELVQYDCVNESLASWMKNAAKKVHLTRPDFLSVVQMSLEEVAKFPPADLSAALVDEQELPPTPAHLRLVQDSPAVAPVRQPAPYVAERRQVDKPSAELPPETPEEYEARKQRYYEVFGVYDSFEPEAPKRRWFS